MPNPTSPQLAPDDLSLAVAELRRDLDLYRGLHGRILSALETLTEEMRRSLEAESDAEPQRLALIPTPEEPPTPGSEPPSELDEPWVSQQECAEYFGRTARTVRRWNTQGCPHRRRYAAVEYQLTAVAQWLLGMGEQTAAAGWGFGRRAPQGGD